MTKDFIFSFHAFKIFYVFFCFICIEFACSNEKDVKDKIPLLVKYENHSMSQSNSHLNRSMSMISFPECDPLLPTSKKLLALKEFRKENAPLIFWHVQKSGGTYFSELFDNEYERRGYGRHKNVYYQFFDADALDISRWKKSYRPKGYYALFIEPGHRDRKSFPVNYRTFPVTQVLLNEKKSGEQHHHAWDDYVHVMTIRKPLDLAMSALRYEFWKIGESIFDTCVKHKLNANDCMQELFRIKEHKKHTIGKYFNEQQKNRIREEVLGNFTINHLSLTGDLEEAKTRLSRFHLIIDLSLGKESDYLISCVLGWKLNHDVRANKNSAVSAKDVFSELKKDTLDRWSQYLKYEQELYDHALTLMKNHYERVRPAT